MVRKPVFSREEIIEAGLAVVSAEGLAQLSARHVAEELGASTAPVYSNFSNMEDLETAVKKCAVELLWEHTQVNSTDDAFLNIGIGVLNFAWDHPRLYAALFLEQDGKYNPGYELMERIMDVLAAMPQLASLEPMERLMMLKKMAIFSHGLAIDICTGRATRFPREELISLMAEVGDAVVTHTFARGPRSAEEIARLTNLFNCGSESHEPRTMPEEKNDDDL